MAILTDLKYRSSGVRRLTVDGNEWTLVVFGTVGFVMDPDWNAWWTHGGNQGWAAEVADGRVVRAAGLRFPRIGWRRGVFVVRMA